MISLTARTPLTFPEQYLRDDPFYEVVGGRFVETPSMWAYDAIVASKLLYEIARFANDTMGRTVCEMLFALDEDCCLMRRPDVAFVSYDRWPRSRNLPETEAWDVIPELAVEFVNRSTNADEIRAKLREYFSAGCQRVWVFHGTERSVHVYRSATQFKLQSLHDNLDGEFFLPGLRLPLRQLFETAEV